MVSGCNPVSRAISFILAPLPHFKCSCALIYVPLALCRKQSNSQISFLATDIRRRPFLFSFLFGSGCLLRIFFRLYFGVVVSLCLYFHRSLTVVSRRHEPSLLGSHQGIFWFSKLN